MRHFILIAIAAVIVLALLVVTVPCKVCRQSGEAEREGTEQVPCEYCHGRGTVASGFNKKPGAKSTFQQKPPSCPRCGGKGSLEERIRGKRTCTVCEGSGKRPLFKWLFDRSGL